MNKDEEDKLHKFVTFNVDYTDYKTQLTKKYSIRKPFVPFDEKKILSFIPGTIRKVFIKEKDKVKKGDKLLVLEAMKMKNELMAPCDGIVKAVYVKSDDKVANKQLLVELL